MKNLGQITNNKDIATKEYVDNSFSNGVTMITATIPRGRMRGDVDGDGLITKADYTLLGKILSGEEPTPTADTEDYKACDVNNDSSITIADTSTLNSILNGTAQIAATSRPEITGNWHNNTYDFYTDIAVSGMTTSSISNVSIEECEYDIFEKAEPINGGIRIYALTCPVYPVKCVITYRNLASGTGVATISSTPVRTISITENSTDSEIPSAKAVYSLFASIVNANGVSY